MKRAKAGVEQPSCAL